MGLFKKEVVHEEPVEVVEEVIETVEEEVKPQGTVIAEGVTFIGNFTSDEQITISGTVNGDIKSTVDTHITKTGSHVGKLDVRSMHLEGLAESEAVCSDLASLGATANFKGTLITPSIDAEHGSMFEGDLHLNKQQLVQPAAESYDIDVKDFSDLE